MTCDMSMAFSGYSDSSTNKTDYQEWQYNWNTVESGIKHHIPNSKKIVQKISDYSQTCLSDHLYYVTLNLVSLHSVYHVTVIKPLFI